MYNLQEVVWRQRENMPGKILYFSLYTCDSLQEVYLKFQLLLCNTNDFVPFLVQLCLQSESQWMFIYSVKTRLLLPEPPSQLCSFTPVSWHQTLISKRYKSSCERQISDSSHRCRVLFYCYQADWTHPFEFKIIIERTIFSKETQDLGQSLTPLAAEIIKPFMKN